MPTRPPRGFEVVTVSQQSLSPSAKDPDALDATMPTWPYLVIGGGCGSGRAYPFIIGSRPRLGRPRAL